VPRIRTESAVVVPLPANAASLVKSAAFSSTPPGAGVRRSRSRCVAAVAGSPFVLATWTATVGPDIPARVAKTIYSVPWQFNRATPRRRTPTVVQIFHNGQLSQRKGGNRRQAAQLSHYPSEKIAFRMRIRTWCRTRAGPICAQLITGW